MPPFLTPFAVGICGSGYIDALAELLRAGLIDRAGKINPDISGHPRIGRENTEKNLSWPLKRTSAPKLIWLSSETDIENLKRAKGGNLCRGLYVSQSYAVKLHRFRAGFYRRRLWHLYGYA